MDDPAGQKEPLAARPGPGGPGTGVPGAVSGAASGAVRAVRIPPELDVAAAARLVSEQSTGSRQQAARRMVTAAAVHGIDLSLMWGTVERGSGRPTQVRQVVLGVPGSGRTAMLVVSGAGGGNPEVEHVERVASIQAACDYFREQPRPDGRTICLAQALLEPHETWAVSGLEAAGFRHVGELAYMRASLTKVPRPEPEGDWPEGVSLRVVRDLKGEDHGALVEALDRSYEETLDCPELCGLRETVDVLESHRATGTWDPNLWWLVMLDGRPRGCMLLNRFPDQGSAELVYLGLSPELRGKGIGTRLLKMGLARASQTDSDQMTCAVDLRNTPALRLYERLGFKEFGRRIAMVKPLGK